MFYIDNYTPYPYASAQPEEQERQAFILRQRKNESRRIAKYSMGAALATGGFFLLANIFYGIFYANPVIFESATASDPTERDLILRLSADLIITLLSLLLPFGLVYFIQTKKMHVAPISLGKPCVNAKTEALIVVGGCGLLALSSYVTNYLTVMFETLTGIDFQYSFFDTPASAFGLVIFYLRAAIMPAITEEFAMRGVVMQPLRRYGDLFALTMSSMVFALMHGNMIQTPFAFLAGFILGYAVIRTGSLWTSIVIHCINNVFSVTISVIDTAVSEQAAGVFSVVGLVGLILVGVAASVILGKNGALTRLQPNRTLLATDRCVKRYIFTVPMILVLLYMLFQTALMIDIPGVADLADWYGALTS